MRKLKRELRIKSKKREGPGGRVDRFGDTPDGIARQLGLDL